MFHGLASAMHDLNLARTAFGGHQFDAAVLDGFEELGAYRHGDVVLLFFETIAAGNAAAAGIGVDSVWKMQFAIDHCGALKIIYASIAAGFGKLFGKRGVFYDIAGDEVRGLDGFYDHCFDEYGNYGIRLPENPSAVCDEIERETGIACMVVDANDFTRDILGKSSSLSFTDEELADMIRDNPAGQSTQLTPMVLIRKI